MQIPKIIPLDIEGQYCIDCFSGPIKRVYHKNLTFYKCHFCHKVSERSLVIDNAITWWIDKHNIYWHKSVGVIVVNKENKILCILRQIFPFAYTIPAGHLNAKEKPEKAALRELDEETGIKAGRGLELIGKFDIPGDSCRRGSDHHKWYLYRLKMTTMNNIRLSDETSTAHWYNLDELKKMNNLTFSLTFIINKFGQTLINKAS